MNKQELEERLNEIGSKIDQTITLWSVGCPQCISFNEGSNGLVAYSYQTQGLMDGKDIEYKTSTLPCIVPRDNKPMIIGIMQKTLAIIALIVLGCTALEVVDLILTMRLYSGQLP